MIGASMLASAAIAAAPPLGVAEGQCRPNEPGPAILVTAAGLKDRTGVMRLELYPPDQDDFLKDDAILIHEGKTFRRVVTPLPADGPVTLCIRAPGPGSYALALIHDRDGKPKFNFWQDGIGFAGNPKIGHGAPPASAARIVVGAGIGRTTVVMNYRHGLLLFGPIGDGR